MQKRFGNPEKLSVEEMIKKYKYTKNIPYWQTKEALEWISKMVESDELQENLSVIKNSASTLRKINKIIPIVAYISTRPQKVIDGTRKWLVKNKFPKADIILRPGKDGNKWKAKVLEFLYPKVSAIIDDNPSLIKYLSKNYKGTIFLYDSDKYETSNIKVIPCKDWGSVLFEVKQIFEKGK